MLLHAASGNEDSDLEEDAPGKKKRKAKPQKGNVARTYVNIHYKHSIDY